MLACINRYVIFKRILWWVTLFFFMLAWYFILLFFSCLFFVPFNFLILLLFLNTNKTNKIFFYRLEPILTPYLSELQGLNTVECSQQTKAKTIFHLKLIASLFQSLDVKPKHENKNHSTSALTTNVAGFQHPVALIFPQILPLLQQVIVQLKWWKVEYRK